MRQVELVAKATSRHWQRWLSVGLGLLLLTGCGEQRMVGQAKYEVFEASTFFEDGRSARELVPNTVARGQARLDTHLYTGTENGAPATRYPFPVTPAVLKRGQERYAIYCTPCHGYDGYGQGIVVQRGLSPPPSLHEARLREAPPGYLFGVITNGIGAMYSYDYRVAPEDRWAIVAYLQALQLSQSATIDDVPTAERQGLQTTNE